MREKILRGEWDGPHSMLLAVTGLRQQCLVCFGYRDDPRHTGRDQLVPLTPEPLPAASKDGLYWTGLMTVRRSG